MGSMLLITIVATCISQLDRLIIGWFYGLEVVGRYVNIVMLAQSGSLLLLPVMASVYPKMISLGLKNNFWNLSLYKYLYVVLGMNALFTFVMILLFPKIYATWTQIELPEEFYSVYLCAVWSNALNGFQLFAYHLMLARGDVSTYARYLMIFLAILPIFYFGIFSFFSISLWGYPILLINLILTYYLMMRLYRDFRQLFHIHAKFLFATAFIGTMFML
jgi:O-antigen/teichoic acid export membrane protein